MYSEDNRIAVTEEVEEILSKHISFKFMKQDWEEWIKIENDVKNYVPVNYSFYFVNYQNTYFSEQYQTFMDFSLVLYNGGKAVGVWPLSLWSRGDSGNLELGSWGGELLEPLLVQGYSTESRRKIYAKCIKAIEELCLTLHISHWQCRNTIMDKGTSVWTQMLLEKGARCIGVNAECFVDLTLSEEEILTSIRRTNKYSILKGKELWQSKIVDCHSTNEEIENCFESFERLHIEVAGRRTRSAETWKTQMEAVKNTDDFVIMLFDNQSELIGASLYSTTATAGTYSVAAYKRELFDKPVAHISQWIAIRHMRQLGMRWYYVGTRFYPGDWNEPTDKEISIGHFKEGFATNIYNTLHIDMAYEKRNV